MAGTVIHERARLIARAFVEQLKQEIENSRYGSIKRFAVETGRSYGSFRRYFLPDTDPQWRDPKLTVMWLALADLAVDEDEFIARTMGRLA